MPFVKNLFWHILFWALILYTVNRTYTNLSLICPLLIVVDITGLKTLVFLSMPEICLVLVCLLILQYVEF